MYKRFSSLNEMLLRGGMFINVKFPFIASQPCSSQLHLFFLSLWRLALYQFKKQVLNFAFHYFNFRLLKEYEHLF